MLPASVSLPNSDRDDASFEGTAWGENAHIAGWHQDATRGTACDQRAASAGAGLQFAGISYIGNLRHGGWGGNVVRRYFASPSVHMCSCQSFIVKKKKVVGISTFIKLPWLAIGVTAEWPTLQTWVYWINMLKSHRVAPLFYKLLGSQPRERAFSMLEYRNLPFISLLKYLCTSASQQYITAI